MDFVRNAWYAAAWGEEVSRALLPRTILNENIVLFRKEDGAACALRDRCPHRFAPLSIGRLLGDSIECLYHGLRFNARGICVENPNGNGIIPKAAQVKNYPLVEKDGLLWIWMGEASLAYPSSIPDYHWLTDVEHYTSTHGYLKLNACYLLALDNLTDLSHAAFVHASTLEPREMAKEHFKVVEENEQIWAKLFFPSMEVPALFQHIKGFRGRMDHWLEMRCDPPCAMLTFYGVTHPGNTRQQGYGIYAPNILTPETDSTTHYFWGSARDFDRDDAAMTAAFKTGVGYALENEDRVVLEAQQRELGGLDLMDLQPVLLANDAASVRARRALVKRIHEEKSVVSANPSQL